EINNFLKDMKRSKISAVARRALLRKNNSFQSLLQRNPAIGNINTFIQLQTGGGGEEDDEEQENTNIDEPESTLYVHSFEEYMDLMDEIDDNLKTGIEWYHFKELFAKTLLMATVYYENPDQTFVYADAAAHDFYNISTPEEFGPAFDKLMQIPIIKNINSEFIYKYEEFMERGAEIAINPVPDDVAEYTTKFTAHLDYLVRESDTTEFSFSATERSAILEENKQWLDLIRTDDKIFYTLYGDLYTLKRTDPAVQRAINTAKQRINSKPTYGTTAVSTSERSVVSPPLSTSSNLRSSSEVAVSAGGYRRTLSRLGKRRGKGTRRHQSALTRSRRTRRRK
ncbi:MAG: hypothetical protein EBU33_09785, partial [Sphingobacteriia bacterium]|nr:hypothetical protein [Sphingobacteriia bacterium]